MSEAALLALTGTVDDPAAARRFVRERLDGVSEDVCQDAMVAVSELVTNVHLHGRTPAELALHVSGSSVRIEVFDSGSDIPVSPEHLPPPTQGGGRGLFIVAALARSWGIRSGGRGPGKTVWIELGG